MSFGNSSTFNRSTLELSVAVSISWSPPSQPNGVITDYNVTVYRSDNTGDIVYRNATATDTVVTVSVEVSPFTNYTVSVSASTAAGEGESAEVIVTSPQAGRATYLTF